MITEGSPRENEDEKETNVSAAYPDAESLKEVIAAFIF